MTNQNLYNKLEYAVEFAWQLEDKPGFSRAERRHQIVDAVLDFIEDDSFHSEEDIDLLIEEYIMKKLCY